MDQSANHILLRGGQPGAADRMRDLLARTVQDTWRPALARERAGGDPQAPGRAGVAGQGGQAARAGRAVRPADGANRRIAAAAGRGPGVHARLGGVARAPIRALSAQVKPVAELPALWADLGDGVGERRSGLPRLQAAVRHAHPGPGDAPGPGGAPDRAAAQRFPAAAEHGDGGGTVQPPHKAMAELSQRAGYLDKQGPAVKGRIDQGLAAQTARFEQGVAARRDGRAKPGRSGRQG